MYTLDLLFPSEYPRWIYCGDGTAKIVDSRDEWIQMSHTHGPQPEFAASWAHYLEIKDKPAEPTSLLSLTESLVQEAAEAARKAGEEEAVAKLPVLSDDVLDQVSAKPPKRKRNAKNST
jgi:hypothetical protein